MNFGKKDSTWTWTWTWDKAFICKKHFDADDIEICEYGFNNIDFYAQQPCTITAKIVDMLLRSS